MVNLSLEKHSEAKSSSLKTYSYTYKILKIILQKRENFGGRKIIKNSLSMIRHRNLDKKAQIAKMLIYNFLETQRSTFKYQLNNYPTDQSYILKEVIQVP